MSDIENNPVVRYLMEVAHMTLMEAQQRAANEEMRRPRIELAEATETPEPTEVERIDRALMGANDQQPPWEGRTPYVEELMELGRAGET